MRWDVFRNFCKSFTNLNNQLGKPKDGEVINGGWLPFQVREQLGEVTMRAQREQNGPAEAQHSQVTGHPLFPVREHWTVTRTPILCLSMISQISLVHFNIKVFWLAYVGNVITLLNQGCGLSKRWLKMNCCISSLSSSLWQDSFLC